MNEHDKMHADPGNWKVKGIFYHNTKDERMLVPKKNPNLGLTLNFAKRGSYLLLVVLLAFIISIIAVIEFTTNK